MVKTTFRVGFRPGQLRPRAILLDIMCLFYLFLGKQLVFYWTGSDVPRTARLLGERGGVSQIWSVPVTKFLLRRSQHCVAAPWLADELRDMGYLAESFPFPTPTERFEGARDEKVCWPDMFTVLTYVPDHNHTNYCGEEILDLAKRMPDVAFRVMGGEGRWCSKPPENLTFLGWTDSLKEYQRCIVVLRAVRHDALGGTVREALLCRRYVLYTYPHDYTELLPHPDQCDDFVAEVEKRLEGLRLMFSTGELSPNHAGQYWVIQNLSEKVLAQRLAKRWIKDADA